MQLIQEQNIKIKATLPGRDASKKQEVFYNPVMKFNRDISILILNSIKENHLQIADPLAGSGIRSLRFLQELKKDKIQGIHINDLKPDFPKTFQENLKLNKIKNQKNKIKIHNQEANIFLLNSLGFDYIDIDPFGSPNHFLNNAIVRLSRTGILAVTATDTAALTGTYLNPCRRKYWAEPLRNELMHEIGLRILIRKIQLIGAQFDKALTPIFSYSKEHYFRIFFRNKKAKQDCDKLLKQHQYFHHCSKCLNQKVSQENSGTCSCGNLFLVAGSLWIGNLFDKNLIKQMKKENYGDTIGDKENIKFLGTIFNESKKNLVGFYDLHKIAKAYKIEPPRMETALKKLKGTKTHFSPTGIKTELNIKEIIKII